MKVEGQGQVGTVLKQACPDAQAIGSGMEPAEDRTSAGGAEDPVLARRGFKDLQQVLALDQAKLSRGHGQVGAKGRTLGAATFTAMADLNSGQIALDLE